MEQQQTNQQLAADEREDDDRPVGRILSRRADLVLLGSGSALFLGAMNALAAENVYLPIIGFATT